MISIKKVFHRNKEAGRGTLIGYVTGGYPSMEETVKVADAVVSGGADIVEIGVPFSDPVADGPVIQKSTQEALSKGASPSQVLQSARIVKNHHPEIPIVLLTYYNIPYRFGLASFLSECSKVGVNGVVVADLPAEEAGEFCKLASGLGVDGILLASPSTSEERLRKILGLSTGFVYLVSLYGVTGARSHLLGVKGLVTRVQKVNEKGVPIAVGFGISVPSHVKECIGAGADGVIIGSAIVQKVKESLLEKDDNYRRVSDYVKSLKQATAF